MSSAARPDLIAALREEVRAIATRGGGAARMVLPFGLDPLDRRLADGGLVAGALHEAAGAETLADDAAATLFLAGIAARRCAQWGDGGTVLWAFGRRELFAPGLAQAGLGPDRLIHAEAGSDQLVLAVMEEGLRHGGLAAVVGEVTRPVAMAATRRLQLAAEERGTTALLLRRPGRAAGGSLAEPSAAMTRWRVAAAPSCPTAVGEEGIGRACWRLGLVRQRGGEAHDWIVEGSDAEGRLALPAGFRDGPPQAAGADVHGPVRAAA